MPVAIAASRPVGLGIASVGILAPVVPTTTTGSGANKALSIPADIHTVGWWINSALPGASGTTLLAGHVDWYGEGPGALYRLIDVRAGAQIVVRTAAGKNISYVASTPHLESKSSVANTVWSTSGPSTLVLITCGGPFNASDGQYLDNVVEVAHLATQSLPGSLS
ncbi:MAG: class F sortase [Acidimicrobiales bacterium]